ncbi:MAG: phosphoribosylglycinamide formyltransferase [Gemmatimonadota bacterium]
MSLPLAVFASGGGSNLQALLDRFGAPDAPARVALVVSDRPDAGALERAARADVPGVVIPVRGRPEDEVAAATLAALEEAAIELVALAGYLRLVPAAVTRRFRGRMLNIHPALLPAFGGSGMYGRRVHEAVLAAGCTVSGATVHLVDERYDEGRPLAQWPVPVLPDDTPERLAARVLAVEHRLYPAVVAALACRLAGQPDAPAAGDGEPAFILGRLDHPGAVDVRRFMHVS